MYHLVTRESSDRPGGKDEETTEAPEASGEDAGATEKKERVLHTRVPVVLERELKRFAENLRIPVSNLVRAILEDAMEAADVAGESVEGRLKRAAQTLGQGREQLKKRVLPDPFEGVFAFQPVTLAQPTTCAKCQKKLAVGMTAHLGLTDSPPRKPQDRRFACDTCVPH
jgi:hypothetical protein